MLGPTVAISVKSRPLGDSISMPKPSSLFELSCHVSVTEDWTCAESVDAPPQRIKIQGTQRKIFIGWISTETNFVNFLRLHAMLVPFLWLRTTLCGIVPCNFIFFHIV